MIGKTISHYKILEKLGEGGMGVVYKAFDTNLERTVALKLLKTETIGDHVAKERFFQEAKAASSLNHSNICTIHEIDYSHERDFICMEYVEGKTIKQKIDSAPLSLDEVLEIGIQIAEALREAHEHGIVHRDIKSENIIVTEKKHVKVLDFGLAKIKEKKTITKLGTTLGTVAYMSPEQSHGQKADHRTDIWSLGVVLYEMLTGQLPFKGDYESAVIYSILNRVQEPITGLRTGVPISLESIVSKCLEKDRGERYQHADELIVDLRKLKKDPLARTNVSKEKIEIEPIKKRSKLLKWSLTAIIIAFLILIGILIIDRFTSIDEPNPKLLAEKLIDNSIAVLPFQNISTNPEQEYFCDGMTWELINNLSKILNVRPYSTANKYKESKKTNSEIINELKVAYLLTGGIQKSGNRIKVNVGLIKTDNELLVWSDSYNEKSDSVFAVQEDISKKIAENIIKLTAMDIQSLKIERPTNAKSYDYYMKGLNHYRELSSSLEYMNFQSAEFMYKKAIELDSTYAPLYAALADLYGFYGWINPNSEYEKYQFLSNELAKKAYHLNPNSAEANVAMGNYLVSSVGIEIAYEKFKRAVELSPNNIICINSLAEFSVNRGLCNEALKLFNRAVELDPSEPWWYASRAYDGFSGIGDHEEAEKDFQIAFAIDSTHWYTLMLYSQFLIRTEKYDKAKTFCIKWSKVEPDNLCPQALVNAIDGNIEIALDLTKRFQDPVERFTGKNKKNIFIILGKTKEAMDYLIKESEYFYNLKSSIYLWLKNDPIYDGFRDNSLFQEILEKHKELYEDNKRKYGELLL